MASSSSSVAASHNAAKRARTDVVPRQQQVVAWERFNTLHFYDRDEDVVVPVSVIVSDLDLPWFNGRLSRVLQQVGLCTLPVPPGCLWCQSQRTVAFD
jgi:hypothetical protein